MDDLHPAMRDLLTGGEDEEWQDFMPPSVRGARDAGLDQPFLEIHIDDNADGSATVTYHTNDLDGDGVAELANRSWHERVASWSEHWPSADEALIQLGPPGVEPSGRVVHIFRNRVPIV